MMNLKARIKKASEELAAIPRVLPHGRDTDPRLFEAYIQHVVVGGHPAPDGALQYALHLLPEDEGPPSLALAALVQDTLDGAQPGEEHATRKLTGARRRALSRWFACLLKGIAVPELLRKELGLP